MIGAVLVFRDVTAGYLTKPIDREKFLAAVAWWVAPSAIATPEPANRRDAEEKGDIPILS